jgi:hypothetical protein
MKSLRLLVVSLLAAAAFHGCYHVGTRPGDGNAPEGDADSDSDTDADADSDSDDDSDSDTSSDTDDDTDTGTDEDTDDSTDTGTDEDTCVPAYTDYTACEPGADCCGFPDPSGEVTVGVGSMNCTGQWYTGDTHYNVSCTNLGTSVALCSCSSWW